MSRLRIIAHYGRSIPDSMREQWDPIRIETRVYRDAESDEWRVRLFRDGALVENADSFHSDKSDAMGTALAMLDHASAKFLPLPRF